MGRLSWLFRDATGPVASGTLRAAICLCRRSRRVGPRATRSILPLSVISLFALTLLTLAISCGEGTETGNPEAKIVNTYTNDDYSVQTNYDDGWSYKETGAVIYDADTTGSSPAPPAPASTEGINTTGAAYTEFTGTQTKVTIYFVGLGTAPTSLESYLNSVYSSRTFETFSNDYMSGFKYDKEYYFLSGTTLLYVVTDLFDSDGGQTRFQTFINNLRFTG